VFSLRRQKANDVPARNGGAENALKLNVEKKLIAITAM
jgi:hypothetical protein